MVHVHFLCIYMYMITLYPILYFQCPVNNIYFYIYFNFSSQILNSRHQFNPYIRFLDTTLPWDPSLLVALQSAPTPNTCTGGGDWFMDSGATAHMFSNLGNLTSFSPTNIATRITLGDGSSLPITHVGSTSFPSSITPINMGRHALSCQAHTNMGSRHTCYLVCTHTNMEIIH